MHDVRYVLLAGTLMSAVAVPHLGFAFDSKSGDGRIIVAQNDPKDKNKSKQQQQQQQPRGPTPGAQGQQGGPQQFPKQGTQQQFQKGPSGGQQGGQPGGPGQQPGQQRQFGNQPGNQQFQQGSTPGGQQPGGRPGQQFGPGQQKQFGNQPSNQQFQQGGTQPGGQPGPGQQFGPGQQKQFGRQPTPGNQQFQQGGTQPGGQQPGGRQFGPGQQPGGTQQGGIQPGGQQPGARPGQQFGPGQQPGGQQQFGRQTPSGGQAGLSPQGGNINELRQQRQTRTDPSGKATIIQEGNRTIVKEGNRAIIRSDENERFRRLGGGDGKVERRGNETYTFTRRPGGGEVINITDSNGQLVRRVRRGPDGREVVLIDNRRRGPGFGTGLVVGLAAGVTAGVLLNLAPPVITIPRERYIVDLEGAPPDLLYETLDAPPLMAIERPYTLDEIRYNVELRDRMRRIDINTITFDTGSWEVTPDQYDRLAGMAEAMQRVLRRRPNEVFMIEGHTDAVGSDEDNLSLSDRRAESVAIILSEHFGIPPENLVTQGYGEQYLKVQTLEANRLNRRVAVRPIGPLLAGGYQN